MRFFIIRSVLFGIFLSITAPANSAAIPLSAGKIIPVGEIYRKIATMKIKDFQKLAGRKLTIKEKIGFLVLKHKLNNPAKENTGKGQQSLIFGIVGLGLFVLGFFVPYVFLGSLISAILAIVSGAVAKKQDPSDKKAIVGKLLGWITLGLIALLTILVAIIIAAWASGSFWG
ncbi:MAG: hypothetical protein IPQ06_08335 [Chitinophagaceae bacterium]|nr:hypothetical protein [Chitinophagaceae bacterium]